MSLLIIQLDLGSRSSAGKEFKDIYIQIWNCLFGSATNRRYRGDGIIISDASDSDNMKQALVSDITNFVNTNTSLNNLTDVLVENNSTYVGNSPSNTNTASNNVGVGTAAMSSVTTGDDNTAVGYNALLFLKDLRM